MGSRKTVTQDKKLKTKKIALKASSVFDVVVIGGGSAGIAALEGARAAGIKSLCLIESDSVLGGECTRWACVPTKAMLKAAKLYHLAKYHVGRYGIHTGRVTYNFSSILHRRDAVVSTLTGHGKRLLDYAKQLKVTVKHGEAKFLDDGLVELRGERIRAKAFVIATGSREREPVIAGLEETPVWYSRDVVAMKSLPSSVAIVGAGPVGSEFATLFGLLGVQTTLLEVGEQILPREDAELAALAEASLRHQGVHVLTKTKTLGLKTHGRRTQITFQVGRKPRQTLLVDHVIVATGRRANVDHLALEQAKVKLDDRGRLVLSPALQTSAAHIFAAGDVTARYQFTHTAHHEGYIAGWNAAQVKLGGPQLEREERVVPRITFVDPEVSSVGLTLFEASKAKLKFKVYRCPLSILGRAAIDGNRDGLLKVIVETKTGQILGAHVTGERAGEIMHELALAMYAKIPFATVQSMLHAYPSWSEAIPAAE